MEALSLFDFDFEQTQSESEIVAAFEILKQEFKKSGNYYCMDKSGLPFEVRSFYPAFAERGWITLNNLVYIQTENYWIIILQTKQ